jgi:hypothetical protein
MSEVIVSEQCPNCQATLHGQFCFACGQNQKPTSRHFLSLASEALEDIFTPTSRTARTILALCFKPGFLSHEYFSGHRARYIQPVRLYFITSISFFFIVSLFSGEIVTTVDINDDEIVATTNKKITLGSDVVHLSLQDEGDKVYVEEIDWDFLSDEQSKAVTSRLNTQIEKAVTLAKEEPDRARQLLLDVAPPVIFCLLPIFAALLKLFYLGKDRFYTEHLVLALHNHSFLFIALLLSDLAELLPEGSIREWIATPLNVWLPLYLLLSLKVTYQQGWLTTFTKFTLLGISYSLLLLMVGLLTIFLGVVTL